MVAEPEPSATFVTSTSTRPALRELALDRGLKFTDNIYGIRVILDNGIRTERQ